MGIFTTTADTYANNFYGPQNYAYNNPGWGVDPNLMTPSYAAPYRPQFQGPGPYQNAHRPGFFGSAGRLLNPFYSPPLHQFPGRAAEPYFEGVAYVPPDSFMTAAQRYIVPGIAMGAAMKYLGPNTGSIMGDLVGTFTGKGAAGAFGRSFGSAMGSGFARGVGLSGSMAKGVAGVMGGIGATVGSLALPFLAAEGAARLADATIFDPYINTRRTAYDLRQNFSGVTFGDDPGSIARGGRGISHWGSYKAADQITRAGIRDMALSGDDYASISSMSARAGLLDNVSSQGIAGKVKSIADQVKLIIQISQDPSIQNAVEQLAKLQMGGASLAGGRLSQASTAFNRIGLHASAAGASVASVLSGVGQQGELLYRMNGMTPYLGQIAAANIQAGFSTGWRTGLLGEAQMARLGGIDGAVQAAMTGSISAMQTPYARMAMYNQYMGGMRGASTLGAGMGVSSTVAGFGLSMGGNPLAAMGAMSLYGNQMSARAMDQHGSAGIERMAISLLQASGQKPGPKGWSPELIAMALSQMGYSSEQVQAFLAQRQAETDPASLNTRLRGYGSQATEQLKGYLESEGLLNTLPAKIGYGVRTAWRDIKSATYSAIGSPINAMGAAAGEGWEHAWDAAYYGTSVRPGDATTADALFGRLDEKYQKAGFKRVGSSGKFQAGFKGFNRRLFERGQKKAGDLKFSEGVGIAESIQRIALDASHPGQKIAAEFMSTNDQSKRKSLLAQLLQTSPKDFAEGTYDRLFGSGYNPSGGVDNVTTFLDYIKGSQVEELYVTANRGEQTRFAQGLDNVLGPNKTGTYDDMRMIGRVYELGERFAAGEVNVGNINDIIAKDSELSQLFGNRRGNDAMSYINQVVRGALAQGTLHAGVSANEVGSLASHMKTRGRDIADPTLRKRFQSAYDKNDRNAMSQVLAEYSITRSGGLSAAQKVRMTDGGLSKTMGAAKIAMEAGKAVSRAVDSSSSGIDLESFKNAVSNFDVPVGKFGESIGVFAEAVSNFAKAASGKPAPSSTSSVYGSGTQRLAGGAG